MTNQNLWPSLHIHRLGRIHFPTFSRRIHTMYNLRRGDRTEGVGDGRDGDAGNVELERLVRFDRDAILLAGSVEDGTEFTTK